MNGVHDMGGMAGLGTIDQIPDEPVFRAEWEERAFALMWATGALGKWNLDELRHAIERMPGAEYLATDYYVHWIHCVETLVVEKGIVTRDDLLRAWRGEIGAPNPGSAPMTKDVATHIAMKGLPLAVESNRAAKYQPGDRVLTRTIHPDGHTRLPRYARGKTGVVERVHHVYPFPDTNAHGDARPQHVYLIRFTAQEMWGGDASALDTLCIDLWEDHLDPAA